MDTIGNICRLCFTSCRDRIYQKIDDTAKEVFDALLIDMNWDICRNPVMCSDCAAIVLRCFHFKSVCVCKELVNQLLCSTMEDAVTRFELKNAPKNGDGADKRYMICTFCMDSSKSFVLKINTTRWSFMVDMLPIFLPEKGFRSMKNLKTCASCKSTLDIYFTLLFKRIRIEENINTYLRRSVEIKKSRIEMRELRQFLLDNGLELLMRTDNIRLPIQFVNSWCNLTNELADILFVNRHPDSWSPELAARVWSLRSKHRPTHLRYQIKVWTSDGQMFRFTIPSQKKMASFGFTNL